VIEHPVGGSWARVARVRANPYGIFTLLLHQLSGRVTGGWLRARVVATGAISPQFALTPPDDENYVMPTPFGTAPVG
jgi:hypothetical protein